MIPTRSWIWTLLWPTLVVLSTGCETSSPPGGLRPLPPGAFVMLWRPSEPGSLQPRLEWEAFPRPQDLKADGKGSLSSARSVTYELRIWRAAGEGPGACEQGWCGFPSDLVYARAGLAEPAHTVDTPLAPDTIYLWTVRARFDLDGQPRVTQWGSIVLEGEQNLPPARDPVIPSFRYYRFKTPRGFPPTPANEAEQKRDP